MPLLRDFFTDPNADMSVCLRLSFSSLTPIQAGHSPPHFALAMHPDLVSEYSTWAPTISRLVSLNVPTFLTGSEDNGSLWHNVVIVQELGGRVVVPPRAHRFPVTAGLHKGSARNHNIMAFHGCNVAVQHDLMNAPSTVANFANTRRNLISLGIDIPDHPIDNSAMYPPSRPPMSGGARGGGRSGSRAGGANPDNRVAPGFLSGVEGLAGREGDKNGRGVSSCDLDSEYGPYDADLHELAASFLRGVGVDDMKSLVEAAARLGIPGPEL